MTNDQTVTQALEPCPFCGGEAKWIEDHSVCGVPFGLVVDHLPACFFDLFASISDAEQVARWNTRTAHSGEGRDLLEAVVSAQEVQPYRGWNLTTLNKVTDRIREHLGLPSIRDLNPDIAKMQDQAEANKEAIRSLIDNPAGEGRSNGAGEDIAERLKQCPRIEDARILAPGDRVAEIVVPVSLRDDILAALSAPQGEVEREAFRPMSEWDQRDETVLLLVDYSDGAHPLDDASIAITIGHNNDHNIGPDEADGWKFAGWCWSHDHYVEGKGTPIGWMPLPHHLAALAQPEAGGER